MIEFVVSVVMITYGHEEYIAQAIEGVLIQETTFPIELIIANDASSDNTDAIIWKYINEHPRGNIIKYFKHEKNLGVVNNSIFVFEQASGKYIAVCEGDDYWTDPDKLQKQVDFLESHKNINLCFHQVNYVDTTGRHIKYSQGKFDSNISQFLSYENILENWSINTCSILFRKNNIQIPSAFTDFRAGDQPLCYLINLEKDFYYFSEVMAIYRISESGITHRVLQNELKSDVEFPFLDKLNDITNGRYNAVIRRRKLRTIMKDLKTMKHSGKHSFRTRAQFYLKNFHFYLKTQNGIKMAAYSLLNDVI